MGARLPAMPQQARAWPRAWANDLGRRATGLDHELVHRRLGRQAFQDGPEPPEPQPARIGSTPHGARLDEAMFKAGRRAANSTPGLPQMTGGASGKAQGQHTQAKAHRAEGRAAPP